MQRNIITVLLLVTCYSLCSQIDGYIIDKANNEKAIVVNIPWTPQNTFNEYKFQRKPKQLVNKKRIKIDPNKVLELGFFIEGRNYIYRPVPKNGKLKFVKLVLDGEVSVFDEVQAPTNHTMMTYAPLRSVLHNKRYLVCQDGGEAFYIASINFKKRLKTRLKPCSEFNQFLDSNNLQPNEILYIIEQYNLLCN